MVYDNFNALAIGFVPRERPSEAVFSLVLYAQCVNLFFLQGNALPDPAKRLRGSGNRVRSIRLETVATLDEPEIRELIHACGAEEGKGAVRCEAEEAARDSGDLQQAQAETAGTIQVEGHWRTMRRTT